MGKRKRYVQLSLLDLLRPPPPATSGIFAVGDRVQICRSGQFYGRIVQIEAIHGTQAKVRADSWVVQQTYEVRELKLVKEVG